MTPDAAFFAGLARSPLGAEVFSPAPSIAPLARIDGAALPAPVWCYGRVGSVLDVAHAAPTDAPWTSLLAAEQSAGRGQLRRRWRSPRGNVYAAVRLPLSDGAALWRGSAASPLMGALLVTALRAAGFDVCLKWPNDLVAQPQAGGEVRKVGGILLEERGGTLWAGVGLNVRHAPDAALLRADHALPAGSLQGCFPAAFAALGGRMEACGAWRAAGTLAPFASDGQNDSGKPEGSAPDGDGPDVFCQVLWCWLVSSAAFCYKESLPALRRWQDLADAHLLWRGCRVRLLRDDAAPRDGAAEAVIGVLRGVGRRGGLLLAPEGRPGEQAGEQVVEFFSGSLQLAAGPQPMRQGPPASCRTSCKDTL